MLLPFRDLIRIPANVSSAIFSHRPIEAPFVITQVEPVINPPGIILKDQIHDEPMIFTTPGGSMDGNAHGCFPILHLANLILDGMVRIIQR